MESLRNRLYGKSYIRDSGCVEWVGAKFSNGYGHIGIDGKSCLSHRAMWELSIGPIPEGMCALHACDNPACVNVWDNENHCFLGTLKDNTQDCIKKGRLRPGPGFKVKNQKGENNFGSKLTDEEVRLIRESDKQGKELAGIFGVSQATISEVRRYNRWKHIP